MSHDDDAQRAMEQRALRNVRGLVDKIQETDRREGAAQKRLLLGAVAVIVLVVVAIAIFLPRREAITVEVRPGGPAPAQPASR